MAGQESQAVQNQPSGGDRKKIDTGEISSYEREQDPDYLALQEAKKAAEAEEEAEGEGEGGSEPAEPSDQPPQPAPLPKSGPAAQAGDQGKGDATGKAAGEPTGDQAQQQPMIPKARFDEALQRTRHLEGGINYLQGVIAMLRQNQGQPAQPGAAGTPQGDQAQQQQAQTESLDQKLEAARTKLHEAAEKYDAGDMTLAEFEKIRGTVDDEIWALRREADAAQASAAPAEPATRPAQPMSDELLLEAQLDQLAKQSPYLEAMTDQEMNILKSMAVSEAATRGQPIEQGTARGTYRLRAMVANLANAMGPVWHPDYQPQLASTAEPQQQPAAQPGQPQLSPNAQARYRKMGMAADEPPNPSQMGAAAPGGGEVTEAQIGQMTDDEIQALPPQVRAKFLGAA